MFSLLLGCINIGDIKQWNIQFNISLYGGVCYYVECHTLFSYGCDYQELVCVEAVDSCRLYLTCFD